MKPTPAEILKFMPINISDQMPPITITITFVHTTSTSINDCSARYSSSRPCTANTIATSRKSPLRGSTTSR